MSHGYYSFSPQALVKNPKVYGPLARFAEAKLDENQRKTLAQSLLHIFLMFDRQAELILGIGNAVIDAGNKDGEYEAEVTEPR